MSRYASQYRRAAHLAVIGYCRDCGSVTARWYCRACQQKRNTYQRKRYMKTTKAVITVRMTHAMRQAVNDKAYESRISANEWLLRLITANIEPPTKPAEAKPVPFTDCQ